MEAAIDVRMRRVYDPPGPDEGAAVLIDRLWPRGVARAEATWQEWCRDVAPSNELRRWYGHAPERFREFQRRYLHELATSATAAASLQRVRDLAARAGGRITLVTSAREVAISHAEVLRRVLANQFPAGEGPDDQEG